MTEVNFSVRPGEREIQAFADAVGVTRNNVWVNLSGELDLKPYPSENQLVCSSYSDLQFRPPGRSPFGHLPGVFPLANSSKLGIEESDWPKVLNDCSVLLPKRDNR